MSDLVKRLHEMQDWTFAPCRESADYIEKLEAALRFYACGCKSVEGCNFLGSTCGKSARKALEGKDDR